MSDLKVCAKHIFRACGSSSCDLCELESKLTALEAEAAGMREALQTCLSLVMVSEAAQDDEWEVERSKCQDVLNSSSAGKSLLEKLKRLEEENVVMEKALGLVADKYGDWTESFMKQKAREALSKVRELRNEGK